MAPSLNLLPNLHRWISCANSSCVFPEALLAITLYVSVICIHILPIQFISQLEIFILWLPKLALEPSLAPILSTSRHFLPALGHGLRYRTKHVFWLKSSATSPATAPEEPILLKFGRSIRSLFLREVLKIHAPSANRSGFINKKHAGGGDLPPYRIG